MTRKDDDSDESRADAIVLIGNENRLNMHPTRFPQSTDRRKGASRQ
jgi:hypothetical protein